MIGPAGLGHQEVTGGEHDDLPGSHRPVGHVLPSVVVLVPGTAAGQQVVPGTAPLVSVGMRSEIGARDVADHSSPRAFGWAARVSPTSKISVRGLHDRIDIGTRQTIADRAGAKDFDAFCEWIDRHR